MLFMRGAGPIGYPGSAEVVNMQPPAALIKQGITSLPCIGDGRQSGTSGSPSILNASPEAAAGGGLALLKTGDRVRIDLNKGTAEYPDLRGRSSPSAAPRCEKRGGYQYPAEPDAVAGNPARHGRPARRRHGAEAGGEVSARRADDRRAAGQSLSIAKMSVDVASEIVIFRPRAAVAAYMFDPRNDANWTSGVIELRPLQEGRTPGKVREFERISKFLGRRFGYTYEVVQATTIVSSK